MARMPDLEQFAERHDLQIVTIADLIAYRRMTERLIEPVEMDTPMPTRFGKFRAHLFRSKLDGAEHVALTTEAMPGPGLDGPREGVDDVVTVRVHSECLTGDAFSSLRCDCGPQLDRALEMLAEQEHGVLVYMRQEGRGIGLAAKLRAYQLQDQGLDTVEANESLGFKPDQRDYGIGAQILTDLGCRRIRVMTNNPRKFVGLKAYGIEIVERVPLEVSPHQQTLAYLRTKKEKLGHLLNSV